MPPEIAPAAASPEPVAPVSAEPSPAATAPPPSAKPEKPAPDISGINAFTAAFLGEKVKPATPDPTPKEAPKPAAPEPEKPKPAPKPKAPAPEPPKPSPALTAEDIAKATAEGVSRAMNVHRDDQGRFTKPPEPPKPKVPTELQRKVDILNTMAELYPERYQKGIGDKFVEAQQKLKSYAAEWEAKHPGEKFNEDDPEHATFLDANDVPWEDDDYAEAIAEIRARTIVEKQLEGTRAKLSEFEQKERLREAAPQILSEQVSAARSFWKLLDPKWANLVNEQGMVDQSLLGEIQKLDPDGERVKAAMALETDAATFYRIFNRLEPYNDKNAHHQELSQWALAQEQQLAKAPIEEQTDNQGRRFLPGAQYWKLPKEQRGAYWTLGASELTALRAAETATRMQQKFASEEQKFAAWAAARGLQPGANPPSGQQNAPAASPAAPAPAEPKPVSPEAGAASKMAASRSGGASAGHDTVHTFLEKFLS